MYIFNPFTVLVSWIIWNSSITCDWQNISKLKIYHHSFRNLKAENLKKQFKKSFSKSCTILCTGQIRVHNSTYYVTQQPLGMSCYGVNCVGAVGRVGNWRLKHYLSPLPFPLQEVQVYYFFFSLESFWPWGRRRTGGSAAPRTRACPGTGGGPQGTPSAGWSPRRGSPPTWRQILSNLLPLHDIQFKQTL